MMLETTDHLKDHTHDPFVLRDELLELIKHGDLRIEFLGTAATPLVSVAMSASVLTFLSLQFYFNGSLFSTRLLAGINIILLLIMVFISLITQVMIHRARLRLSRVKHDLKIQKLLDCEEFTSEMNNQLVFLSHLALGSQKTINSIQWMYNHGLFRLLYALITITVTVLIIITLSEIPLQLQSI
ncbi:MAG: hypothetical protein ACW98K_15070 [Candidatus Kariarchaeaceae archaeon]|jgi:hypothetical protein